MTNNLFNGLQVVSGEVKGELLNDAVDISVSLRGEVAVTKGNFEQSFTYWCNNCEETRFGFVDCDDWDYEENATKLGGLPIDSLHQLKQTLETSGLRTLSNSLGFEEDEKRKAVFLAVENSKGFKKQFGKNAKFWRALTDAEQKLVRLGYVIDNFETCGEHDKRNFGIKSYDEDGEEIRNYVPTLEELKALKETLTQL
jgi:hypothetical protein